MDNNSACYGHPGKIMLDEAALATYIFTSDSTTRDEVYREYLADRKIGAIKALRENVRRVIGEPLGLKASKDKVEALFSDWDADFWSASTVGHARHSAKTLPVRRANALADALQRRFGVYLSTSDAALLVTEVTDLT